MECILKTSMPITKDDTGHLLDLRFESLKLSELQFMSHWRFRPSGWAATKENFEHWRKYVEFVNRILGLRPKTEEIYNLAKGIQVDFDDPNMKRIAGYFLELDRQADRDKQEGPLGEINPNITQACQWVWKSCKFAGQDIDFWINKYSTALMELYGKPLDAGAEANYRSKGEGAIASLQASYEGLQKEKQQIELEKYQQEKYQQQEENALSTPNDTYYRVEGTAERVVCDSPDLHIKGMPAYAIDFDSELKGYYSIHTGDAEEWIPILVRDGFCDGKAYIYRILCNESSEPFYETEDHHIVDKTDTPSSTIIFSKYKVIPPQLIRLIKVIEDPQAAADIFPEYEGTKDEQDV